MSRSLVFVALVTSALVSACGAGAQKKAIAPALSAESERRTAFEATARVLDEHLEWVDETYETVRRHPRTFERILQDATHDAKNADVAARIAALLVDDPEALRRLFVETIDAARDPASRAAIDEAVSDRRDAMGDILTDDADAAHAMMLATIDAATVRAMLTSTVAKLGIDR